MYQQDKQATQMARAAPSRSCPTTMLLAILAVGLLAFQVSAFPRFGVSWDYSVHISTRTSLAMTRRSLEQEDDFEMDPERPQASVTTQRFDWKGAIMNKPPSRWNAPHQWAPEAQEQRALVSNTLWAVALATCGFFGILVTVAPSALLVQPTVEHAHQRSMNQPKWNAEELLEQDFARYEQSTIGNVDQ